MLKLTKCALTSILLVRRCRDVFPLTTWKQILYEARKQLLPRLTCKKSQALNDSKDVQLFRGSSVGVMRETERCLGLVIVSMIDYWCNARHRPIFEACDCIDHRLLYCETPNDIGDLWLYRWTIIDAVRDTERYWRLVIISMIDYWRNARHRTILKGCDCIDDRLLAYCETPSYIGGLWLFRWSISDVMRDTDRYLSLMIVSMIEYWCNVWHRTIL